MRMLIVTATALEASALQEAIGGLGADGFETDLLIGGVGLMATAATVTARLLEGRPDFALQAGVGGSFNASTLPPGATAVIGREAVADQGVSEEDGTWRDVFDMGLETPSGNPYDAGWLKNPDGGLLQRTGLQVATGVSVNRVTSDAAAAAAIVRRWHAEIESMEGAAFHYACLRQHIPFLQLRAVSNIVGVRDKRMWRMREALSGLAAQLPRIASLARKKLEE